MRDFEDLQPDNFADLKTVAVSLIYHSYTLNGNQDYRISDSSHELLSKHFIV